jgi:hypothetical protein
MNPTHNPDFIGPKKFVVRDNFEQNLEHVPAAIKEYDIKFRAENPELTKKLNESQEKAIYLMVQFCSKHKIKYKYFDLFITDTLSPSEGARYEIVGENQSQILINSSTIGNLYDHVLVSHIFHELVHAIVPKNYTKSGPNMAVAGFGLSIATGRKFRAKIENNEIEKVIAAIRSRNFADFDDEKTNDIKYLMSTHEDTIKLLSILSNVKESCNFAEFETVRRSKTGEDLDEAIVDFVTTKECREFFNEKEGLEIYFSGYYELKKKIRILELSFLKIDEKLGEDFYNCLIEAHKSNQPGGIIRFIRQNTKSEILPNGFVIKPQELFELNFDKLNEYIEQNFVSINNYLK